MPADSEPPVEDLPALAQQLGQSLGVEVVAAERLSLEGLRNYVAEQVRSTLARNPALMMSILYRVDVPEAEARRVLTHSEPAAIPLQLADLLIQRQAQKLRIRRAYQQAEDRHRDRS